MTADSVSPDRRLRETLPLFAYLSVPFIIANLWLVGWLARRMSWLWATVPPTGLAIAIVLPATAAMISLAARADEQGQVLGNNQASRSAPRRWPASRAARSRRSSSSCRSSSGRAARSRPWRS